MNVKFTVLNWQSTSLAGNPTAIAFQEPKALVNSFFHPQVVPNFNCKMDVVLRINQSNTNVVGLCLV